MQPHIRPPYHRPPPRYPRDSRPYYHRYPRPHYHPHPWFGSIILSLPGGYFAFGVGNDAFYYHSGVYYRRYARGYVVVPAPIGAAVTVLPDDAIPVYIGATRYFYNYGTFYAYNEVHDRYEVVSAPVGAIVPAIPTGFMTVYLQGVKHYVVGGVYYRPVYRGSEIMYEVVPPPDSSTMTALGLMPEYLYAYPNAGQSPEEQARDREECHDWAVEETEFDPQAPPDPTQTGERQQLLQEYNRAFRACMEARNYTVQ